MMRLGDALGGWKPVPGTGGDPLATIRAAWAELVGAEVARAAQPVAITGDALVVITASSAWSHQLSFLTAGVLAAVAAMPGCGGIARLRFRVGAIRAPQGRGIAARRTPRRAAEATVRPSASTAAEALAGLRAAIERSRAAHVAAGGRFCPDCSAPVGMRPGRCTPCAHERERALTEACERLLFDAPWLAPGEVIALVPGLDEGRYDAIRRRLLQSWWDELYLAARRARLPMPVRPDRARLRRIASSYVLLETRIDPHRLDLDSPVRRNALGELFDFVRSVEEDAR